MTATAYSAEFLQLQTAVAGRYSLEREIGRGGMGIVFLARDVALDRPVAIKLLPPTLALRSDLRERFRREARLAARLSHPNIVTIFSVEEHQELVFFVMAYVRGETLAQRVQRAGPLPPSQAVRALQEVAWALGYAHGVGVVHRDVKPETILLEQASGRAMVADFGIALAAWGGRPDSLGEPAGTAQYMSPEQAAGEPVDGRSDIYSLGATGFFALTGRPLFEGASPYAVVALHLQQPPPRIHEVRPEVPPRLAEAIDRCLVKDPAQRIATAEELAEMLAATGLSAREVPAPIRHFFRQGRSLAIGWLMAIALIIWFGRWVRIPPDPVSRWSGIALLAAYAVWPLVFLLRSARRTLRAGFTFDDVRTAAALEARLIAEESSAVYGKPSPDDLANTKEDWLRYLAGPVGRGIFRLAGLGLHVTPVSPPAPATAATELLVGAEANHLFDLLPPEIKERVQDLPVVAEGLWCRIEELRELPESTAERSRVMAALERLRIDLARFEGGEIPVEVLEGSLREADRAWRQA
ncbi:MAG TPA: serine/threonine-protein kinase [Gemmatimonadales bacterium]|nr:serine/threonine-protein kinase [Gemmatimonadales bacterium]